MSTRSNRVVKMRRWSWEGGREAAPAVSPLETSRKGNQVTVQEAEVEVSLKSLEKDAVVRGLQGLFGI